MVGPKQITKFGFNMSQFESKKVDLLPQANVLSSRSTERLKRPMRGRPINAHTRIVERELRSNVGSPMSLMSPRSPAGGVTGLEELCTSRVLEPVTGGTASRAARQERHEVSKHTHIEMSMSSDLQGMLAKDAKDVP